MEWIVEHWDLLLEAAAALGVVIAIIVKLTPTEKDDKVWESVKKLLAKKSDGKR